MRNLELEQQIWAALRADQDGDKKHDHVYASDLGTSCARRLWYTYSGHEEEPHSDETLLKFAWGRAAEEMIAPLLGEVERERRVEVEYNGVPISGRIDFLIDGTKELKSIDDVKKVSGGPKVAHVSQLMTYLRAEAEPEGDLIYVGKHPADIIAWRVRYDNDFWEGRAAKATTAWAAAQGEGPPPPVPAGYAPASPPCSFCPFLNICPVSQ